MRKTKRKMRKIEVLISDAKNDKLMRRVCVVFNTRTSIDELQKVMAHAIGAQFSS